MEFLNNLTGEQAIYLLIPFLSAMIGWLTNFIAVKMIFRPYKPIRILFFKVQGLIPRRQRDLAEKIGDTVERELVSHRDIQEVMKSPDVAEATSKLIEEQIDKFVSEKLSSNPMIGMFLQGEMLATVKQMLTDQLLETMPEFIDGMMSKVEEKLDFKHLVQQKIESFDLSKLESIIYTIARKELKSIEVFGAVLGFLIGVGQVGLLLLVKS